MSYGPKKHVRKRAAHALALVAQAALAGMKTETHKTVSRRWGNGEHKNKRADQNSDSHTVYSTTIDGVVIYRASRAALARIYLELLP